MYKRILLVDFKAVGHMLKFSIGGGRIPIKEKQNFLIYGYLHKLRFLLKKTRADIVVFALDSMSSKRKDMYPPYKENRKNKTPKQVELDALAYPQFDILEDYVFPTIGYKNLFKVDGLEGDDIIGSVCKNEKNKEVVIVSSDHDMYQLLTDTVSMFDIRTNKYYTKSMFEKEYKIHPKMWKRVKAVGGCFSDQVKGVPIPQEDPTKKQQHVAEKGALNYIRGEMNSNTKAFQAIESRAGKDVINRNKCLVILPFRGTPEFDLKPDNLKTKGMIEVCREYGFNSILKDIKNWKQSLKLR